MHRIASLAAAFLLLLLCSFCSPSGAPSDSDKSSSISEKSEKTVTFPKTIVFALEPSWPPFEFINSDGDLVGFSIDYFKEAGAAAGFTPVFRIEPWEGIFDGLKEGKYDAVCSSVSITADRLETMDFSEPYFKVHQVLVTAAASGYCGLSDLSGKKVGAQVRTTGAASVRKGSGVELMEFIDLDAALNALVINEIQAVVCDDPAASHFALADPRYKGKLRIAGMVESEGFEYYGIAVAKGRPDLLAAINAGIREVKASGTDLVLIQKWLSIKGHRSPPP